VPQAAASSHLGVRKISQRGSRTDYAPSKNRKTLVTKAHPVQTGFADSLPKHDTATQTYIQLVLWFFVLSVFSTPLVKGGFMNLTISGHHLEVTPSLREYVLTKLDRVTRHFDQVVDINVLLTVEKQKEKERRQKAEVTVHVKGRDIFVEQSAEDLYAAIDQLMDKLDRQVCRHKDRLQDHHHASAKRLETPSHGVDS
jgi:putative sigma-54 modulation protein